MAEFNIHVNETGEEKDNLLVIILDNKNKTESSFALSRTEKKTGKIKLIASAIDKVTFLGDIDIAKKEAKKLERKKKKSEKK